MDHHFTISKEGEAILVRKLTNEDPGSGVKKLRTQSERYREAVRATHLIANEMADIKDDSEFDDMLRSIPGQWRNVRQQKWLLLMSRRRYR